MTAYLHKDWCGLGDRTVVHPQGLPPGWKHSNLSVEGQQRALAAAAGHVRKVVHLNPKTLEVIETFNLI